MALHGIEVVNITDGTRPVQAKKAGVIGVVGTAGKGPVNTPVLISGSPRRAAETFGQYRGYDVDGFTLPEAFDAIFDQGGASVVVINVCDPSEHTSDAEAETFTVDSSGVGTTQHPFISAISFTVNGVTVTKRLSGSTMSLPSGITITTVQSADGETDFTETDDYTFSSGVLTREEAGGIAENQELLITYETTIDDNYTANNDTGEITVSDSVLEPGSTLSIDYTYVDPSQVEDSDVIGGVQGDGTYTGVHALRAANAEVGLTPRILVAPRWTHQKEDSLTANPVVAEMLGFVNRMRAMIYADTPSTTEEEAIQYRDDLGTKRTVPCYPFVKVLSPSGSYVSQPRSARRAGLAAKVINDDGFHVQPSNRLMAGVVGLDKPVDTGGGGLPDRDSAANRLNENEVSVIIRAGGGFREWGGRTTSSDPAWAFESVVRTADMIQEAVVESHLWAVDRNITKNLVSSILESVNAYLRQLVSRDVILGGRAWVDPDLNTSETVANGELYIDFEFTPAYPAEHITFRSHLVNDYIEEVFISGNFSEA